MAGYIQVPADGVGKRVDTVTLADAGVEVHRQKLVVTGGSGTAEIVAVTNANPIGTEMGLVVRNAGTAQVAIATPFTINNISAVTAINGTVQLTAGSQVIGDINAISRTVQVAISTPFTINNISATAVVAGNLGITGQVSVSGAINLYTTTGNTSASRGPRCVIASTSSNVTLVAAPGAGMAIYVTQIVASNASGTNTRARIGTSANIGQVTVMMAQSAGGFSMPFTPPWRLSTNEALLCSVKPNASEGLFNVHFFVASADAL